MSTQRWHWSRARIVETLALRIALSGKPSPVAALVLARIEGSKS